MSDEKNLSRRQLLAGTVAAGSIALLDHPGQAEARTIRGGVPWQPGEADAPTPAPPGNTYEYFTPEEAAFVEAAVARLIPNDDLGPGALEAGAAIFIDRQMLTPYGDAQRWYMQGPWAEGIAEQGYQSRYAPAQLYRAAIKAIDAYCRSKFGGKAFAKLSSEQQDEVLTGLEKGKIKLDQVDAKAFFEVLSQNTVEGFFSDPIYGGNRGMVGWKLIGFPGARYDYRPWVKAHGKPFPLPPVGISGRPDWTHKS